MNLVGVGHPRTKGLAQYIRGLRQWSGLGPGGGHPSPRDHVLKGFFSIRVHPLYAGSSVTLEDRYNFITGTWFWIRKVVRTIELIGSVGSPEGYSSNERPTVHVSQIMK